MDEPRQPGMDGALALLAEHLAEQLADRLAPRVVELLSQNAPPSPWLSTQEAVDYSSLPESTFRKLASCGKIPSHGGRTKLFYRPEIDQALLGFTGLDTEARNLRSLG
jgi:hypothetical protein